MKQAIHKKYQHIGARCTVAFYDTPTYINF